MRFLIVDDSRAVQNIIKRILESVGYREIELRSALNGADALATLESWKPDLMLTDWHMPGMTGLELLQSIRQMGMHDIKVGFVTTESSARHIEEALRNGAAFVVNKPFNNEVLKQAVLSVLQDGTDVIQAVENAKIASPEKPACKEISAADIRQLLVLSSIICKVENIDPIPVDRIKMPYVLGIYSCPHSKTIDAICLMDLNASCIIGGALASFSSAKIKDAIAAMTLDREIYENSAAFLSDMTEMTSKATNKPLKLTSTHVVQKPFEKLYEMMQHSYGRSDFSISFPAQGDGFITVLLN